MGSDDTLIEFSGVKKRFGSKVIYRGLDLSVRKGEVFTILGGSGVGKSVMLKMLIGLIPTDGGRILFDGDDVVAMDDAALHDVRRRIAYLFQGAALFDSLTVGENVAYGLREQYWNTMSGAEIEERVAESLASVGLPRIEGMRPSDLSGGMKKRAGLARAMALDPPILLVDEPSAGLDPITAGEIDALLVKTKQGGTTLVVVTHNIPSARVIGDEFAVLHEGRMLASGTIETLDASDERLVQAFMRAQGGG